MGSVNKEFHEFGIIGQDFRDNTIKENYTNISSKEAEFGSSIVTFGFAHTAIYFGEDNSGTTYIFTKNGQLYSPDIMSSQYLAANENNLAIGYGAVRNIEANKVNQQNTYNKNLDPTGALGNGGTEFYSPNPDFNPQDIKEQEKPSFIDEVINYIKSYFNED